MEILCETQQLIAVMKETANIFKDPRAAIFLPARLFLFTLRELFLL